MLSGRRVALARIRSEIFRATAGHAHPRSPARARRGRGVAPGGLSFDDRAPPRDFQRRVGLACTAMNCISLAALLGLLAVALGAFGAHGLESRATAEQLAWWSTAAHYHLTHALALLAVGLLTRQEPGRGRAAAGAFVIGIAIFSGTLYGLALGGPRWLGAVTPIGGVALMVGWLLLALAARRTR